MGSEACSGVPSPAAGASPPRTDSAPGTAVGLTPAPRELVGPWVCRCATCGCDRSERCPLPGDSGLEGWRGQWPFCRDSSTPTAPLALPLPLSRVPAWAFLLGPLARPSLLETFLRLSPFPATCLLLLLPAGLGSHQRLHPHTRPPGLPGGGLLFSYANLKSPTSSFFSSERPHLSLVPGLWIPRAPAAGGRLGRCGGCEAVAKPILILSDVE